MKSKLIFSLLVTVMVTNASFAFALTTVNIGALPKPDAQGNINIKTGPNSGLILTPILKDDTAKVPVVKTDSRVTISGFDQVGQNTINTNIKYALVTNPDVTYVAITKDLVTVNYKAPAKLFGFIGIKMNVHVVSDANGKVTVTLPWYKFLVSTKFSNVADDMNTIFQHNQTDLEMTKSQDPAAAQGQILVQIVNVLKAKND